MELFKNSFQGSEEVVVSLRTAGIEEGKLTLEEELRRQRARQQATQGLTEYYTNKNTNKILLPVNGELFVHENNKLFSISKNALTPKFSNNGKYVGFVSENELYYCDLNDTTHPVRLTFDATKNIVNGLAEYIAQEELDRSDGFWWSPDDKKIAFCQYDDSQVADFILVHQSEEEFVTESHKYPFAGKKNVDVKLGVVNIVENPPKIQWLTLPTTLPGSAAAVEFYICRVFWWKNGEVGAQILSRDQRHSLVLRFDGNGNPSIVLFESSAYWINLFKPENFYELKNSPEFIFLSERDGFAHIYRFSSVDGKVISQLTSGSWIVDSIVSVDEENKTIYYIATAAHATELHFYSTTWSDNPAQPPLSKQLSTIPGRHSIFINHQFTAYIDSFSSLTCPPSITLYSLVRFSLLCFLFIFQN